MQNRHRGYGIPTPWLNPFSCCQVQVGCPYVAVRMFAGRILLVVGRYLSIIVSCPPMRILACILVLLSSAFSALAQNSAQGKPGPDDRYKTDILVVVAHPDDETAIAGYLARAIFDQHKRVSIVYGTRGNSGGNVYGFEQAASLGAVREIEARRAVATFGITNVWFLGGPDTPGQDVLRSLETWNHGASLEQVVRIVRLTRPEIIITWLPDYVVGENHGDHQASSVLANEAFDLAADPTKFAEQVAPPRDRTSVGNLTEGLRPWQPKKIYYFSDASHTEFLDGQGPQYSINEVSPSKQAPYNQLIAEEASQHLTQFGIGLAAKEALARHDFHLLEKPIQFVLGKSVVACTRTGDIFEGVTDRAAPFAPVPGYRPEQKSTLTLELGGPWAFYNLFWKAHALDHLGSLLSSPEASTGADGLLHIPLIIRNEGDEEEQVVLHVELAAGWTEKFGAAMYRVGPHDFYPLTAVVAAPPGQAKEWHQVSWTGEANGKSIGNVILRVYVASGGLPQ